MSDVFGYINYWAVLVAGIIYWLLGMLWFSPIVVGKSWLEELKKHGIKVSKPESKKIIEKSIWTFALNVLVAFGVAILVNSLGIHTFGGGLSLGLILSICFAAAAMGISYIWESRSVKLSFYDIFYPFIGILVSSIIIALWR